jgi:hypothetical protein
MRTLSLLLAALLAAPAMAQVTTPKAYLSWPGERLYTLHDGVTVGLPPGTPSQYHAIHDDIAPGTYNSITVRGWAPMMQNFTLVADMQIDVSWNTVPAASFAPGLIGSHHNGTITTVFPRALYTFAQSCSATCFNPPVESGSLSGPTYTINFAQPITTFGSVYIVITMWSVTGGGPRYIPLEGYYNPLTNPARVNGRETPWAMGTAPGQWICTNTAPGGNPYIVPQDGFQVDNTAVTTAMRGSVLNSAPLGAWGFDVWYAGPRLATPTTLTVWPYGGGAWTCPLNVQNLASYMVPWTGPGGYGVDLFNVPWSTTHNYYATYIQMARVDGVSGNIVGTTIPRQIGTQFVDPNWLPFGCNAAQTVSLTDPYGEDGIIMVWQ